VRANAKKTMKPDEEAAMDGMIAAARDRSKGGQVKLAKWREEVPISGLGEVRVWVCGWARDPDPDQKGVTMVGWRLTEEEMDALCFECVAYFDRAIKARRVMLHGPGGTTERLRG